MNIPSTLRPSPSTGVKSQLILLSVLLFLTESGLGATRVATDREDYAPYETVFITGTGFLPSETVRNQITQIAGPNAGANYDPWELTADGSGNFTTAWYVFTPELIGTTLELTSVGATSQRVARTTFTDARTIASAALNGRSSVTVRPGAPISATVMATTSGSGSGSYWRSTSWRISSSPGAGDCIDHANHDLPGTYSESFFITAPSFPGTYDAFFTAYNNDYGTTGASSTYRMTSAVIVDNTAPPAPSTPDLLARDDTGNSGTTRRSWISPLRTNYSAEISTATVKSAA